MKRISIIIIYLLLPYFAYAAQTANSQNTPKRTPIQTKTYSMDEKNSAIQTIQAASLSGDYQTAKKQLEKYLQEYGEDTAYLTEKSRYFALSGNPQQALKIITPLLKNDPENSTLLDIKKYALEHPNSNGISVNPEFPEISPEVSAANDASDASQYKKALALYKEALIKNPNDRAAFLGLARTYLLLENYKAGANTLVQYQKKFGEGDQYLTEKARYLAFTKHPQQSLAVLAPLLKKEPSNDTYLDIKKYNMDTLNSPASASGGSTASGDQLAALAYKRGTNASTFAMAAKAYLDGGDAKKALVMINNALRLDPSNAYFLQFKADIAISQDNQDLAYQTYSQLYLQNNNIPAVILGLARSAGSTNRLDQSARLYEIYLDRFPNDKTAWLEYAYIQSYRGNDRRAISVLDQYHRRFGDSDVYLAERARIVASATRYTESFAIVNSLLPRLPNNYDLNFAKTTDLFYNNRPLEMYQSFKKVKQIEPGTPETTGLWSFINTPYRSNIGLDGYYSIDSDSIKITHLTLNGQYFITPLTFLIGNVTDELLSANISSGLSPIEGGHAVHLYGYNVGINHRFSPALSLQGLIGGQNSSNYENSINYEADVILSPSETLGSIVQLKRSFYDQSPLAVSKGVKEDLGQITVNWQPCIQCFLMVNGGYATFTDTNTLRVFEFRPSAQVIGSGKFNVSLGLDGLFFKFGKVLSNGYYSPTNYKYGGVVTDIYYKYSDNIGYEASIGIGTQHDQTFTTWRPANDYSLKAYYGIYQDWYLTASAALSTRGKSIANNTSSNSTYRVYAFDVTLTRRLG